MDYGLLNMLWVNQLDSAMDFPYTMSRVLSKCLEKLMTTVILYIESFPPEWIDLEIDPAKHLIRIEIEGLPSKEGIDYFPESLPNTESDADWVPLIPLETQLKHWRSSIQGSLWE